MSRKLASTKREPASRPARRPGDGSPRNRPLTQLDASPAQPDAPARPPVEDQQDQQPLDPAPLVNPACDPVLPPTEPKNG